MRSGRAGTAAAVVAMILVVGGCAGEAEGRADAPEPTTTEHPTTTTTVATTTTTTTPAGATAGDLAACEPASGIVSTWGGLTPPDTDQAQAAMNAVLDVAWNADDPQLVAELERVRAGYDALDPEAVSAALVAYVQRCIALGAPV